MLQDASFTAKAWVDMCLKTVQRQTVRRLPPFYHLLVDQPCDNSYSPWAFCDQQTSRATDSAYWIAPSVLQDMQSIDNGQWKAFLSYWTGYGRGNRYLAPPLNFAALPISILNHFRVIPNLPVRSVFYTK
jgi:hypothetical protein